MHMPIVAALIRMKTNISQETSDPVRLINKRENAVPLFDRLSSVISIVPRKGEPKGRSLVRFALNPDPAAMRFHQSFNDRQPKPNPSITISSTAAASFSPVEPVEDAVQILLYDSRTRVLDPDKDCLIFSVGVDVDGTAFGAVP